MKAIEYQHGLESGFGSIIFRIEHRDLSFDQLLTIVNNEVLVRVVESILFDYSTSNVDVLAVSCSSEGSEVLFRERTSIVSDSRSHIRAVVDSISC